VTRPVQLSPVAGALAELEQMFAKRRTRLHYEAMAAEAAASVPTRLGRTTTVGQRAGCAAPADVSAGRAEP
jgi:carbonic anhydrase/acetyltransferase-like protein (isoleucine patch superfamily)